MILRRILLLMVFCASAPLAAEGEHRLELSQWRYRVYDAVDAAAPETDDSAWQTIGLPANLTLNGVRPGQTVWLRTDLNLSPPRTVNLALYLGAVYDSDEVYLNGELIGSGRSAGVNGYGRPRLYNLPGAYLQSGRNILAIKLSGNFPNSIGLRGAPLIDEVDALQWNFWRGQLQLLTFAGLYFAVGIFFSILHFKLHDLREYRWFGLLAVAFGLQQFLVNEARFFVADQFLAFKLLEQLSYVAMPQIYFLFHVNFFKATNIRLSTSRGKMEIDLRRLGFFYLLINGATAAAIIVTMNPIVWDRIITIWFFINAPFFVYYIADSFVRAARLQRDAIILSSGLLVMMAATVHFYAVERGLVEGPHHFSAGILAFVLIVAFALTYRLIDLQMEVDRRSRRLDSVNALRDRVFTYIHSFVREPARKIIGEVQELLGAHDDPRRTRELGKSLEGELGELQASLDDILELSRLEVISEPEYLEKVNFRDFITAVIPQGVITHHVKVHPEIVLNTSLELVNSLVIRLIDFPAFRDFRNIDLMITSDLKAHVHFRFMLYHRNLRVTRHLHEVLTDPHLERGQLWVKWAIVREIIRILDGRMDISIINRKFLRIDIELSGELPATAPGEAPRSVERIFVRPRELESAAVPAPELAGVGSFAGAPPLTKAARERPLPRFHARMTMSELAAYLRARFGR